MIADITLRPAHQRDAYAIATLSRDQIERGLGWTWTTRRVMRSIADADTNVVVALDGAGRLQGFGIMTYGDEEAHLALLAVQASQGRRGIGTELMCWLEAVALVGGTRRIFLEAREANAVARAFYRRLGYREVDMLPGYFQGREDSVRLAKDLWQATGTDASPPAGDWLA